MNTPDPEQLRPLLEAGLAIMSPHDPDQDELQASLILPAGSKPRFTLAAFGRHHTYASGSTPAAAIEAFRANYKPIKSNAERAAELRRQADELEAAQ